MSYSLDDLFQEFLSKSKDYDSFIHNIADIPDCLRDKFYIMMRDILDAYECGDPAIQNVWRLLIHEMNALNKEVFILTKNDGIITMYGDLPSDLILQTQKKK